MNPIDSLFEWLLAATLRASILAMIILGIQLVLRRWLPAQWRYALWLPMLLVMILPALPSAPFGWSPKKASAAPFTMVTQAPVPASHIGDPSPVTALETPAPGITRAVTSRINPVPIIWLAGACVMFFAGIIGYRRNLRSIVATSVTPDESLLRAVHNAAQEAGMRRMPRVLVSPRVESPAVTGIFRPYLLLPAGFPEGFNQSEARLILLHEFSHLKRQDLAVNGLSCVLQALHWFNPIVWFAFARMRADREAACDARVLSIGTADHRTDYGNALLKLQRSYSSPYGLSLGFVGIFERSAGMKFRIREISTHRRAGFAGRAGGAAIVSLLIVFGATKAQEPAKPAVPPDAPANAKKPPTPGQIAIDRKLDAIIIPRVDFEDASLSEGIDFFRMRSVELDENEPNPVVRGINMILLLPPGTDPQAKRIAKLQKKHAPLRDLIVEMCQETGMEFRVDDSALVIYPAGGGVGLQKINAKQAPVGEAADFAAKIIIPRIKFEDTTLQEAVGYLNETARDVAKGGPIIPIVLDPGADPAARIQEIRLRNAPLSAALQYCTDATRHTWTASGKEIRIRLKSGVEKAAPKPMPAPQAAADFANKTIMPRVVFEDITLKRAVDSLNEMARASANGGAVFPIVLDPGADPEAKIRELRISKAPLTVVLQYCTESAGHTWSADDKEIRIRRK